MAPIAHKRRRVEDDARRAKKPKPRVKRQKRYHSSSEDESDDDGRPRVSDAPAKKRAVVSKQQTPKSILKPAPVVNAPVEDEEEEEEEEEEASTSQEESDDEEEAGGVDMDQTALNTALNAGGAGEEGSEAASDDQDAASENDDGLPPTQDAPSTEESDFDDSECDTPMTTNPTKQQKKKRNDPAAFATSISKILDTKLTTAKRTDPILSRSTTASQANASLADQKLEAAARNQLKTEKRALLEKGRVRDVLGLEDAAVETGAVQEEEKRLKKVAQRGVVRLFNAVRAAQVRAEQGEEIVRGEGVVGVEQRKERVGEMSKEGFLELISRGGATGEVKA